MQQVILGSSSQWRRGVLEKHLKRPVITIAPDIDEKSIRHDEAEKLIEMISIAKADAVKGKLTPDQQGAIIICGDQVVRFEGQIREKPVSLEENAEFLRSYRNKHLETVTGLCVENTKNGKRKFKFEIARVHYGDISEEVISKVVQRGDTMTCCGGFAIEDPDLYPCVVKQEGTMDSIQGLPLGMLEQLITEVSNE
eukprot:PhF_6_TR10631/c0_g1_i1/m.17225/K06287/maf; septum formation protein